MLICKDCGESFSEDDAGSVYDDRGYCGSARAYEEICVCPACGCDDIGDAAFCELCEEWKEADLVEDGVCEECRKKTKIEFDRLLTGVFSPLQIRALRQIEEEKGVL